LLPGFDKRLGWSKVPVLVELAAFALVLIGYLMITSVFKANSYASRVVEVEKRPESHLNRTLWHCKAPPWYSSLMVYSLPSPLALGSYWAVIPAALFLFALIPRILGEEEGLLKNLEGYREYKQQVKRRLLPGVW